MYRLKRFCSENILKSIYFSLIHSYISYGLIVWSQASAIYTNKIKLIQKKALRIITNSDYLAHTKPLFKKLNILNFDDMIKHQFASIMWDQDHDLLPNSISCFFKPVSQIHGYNTRMVSAGKLSENIAIHTSTHGKKMFKFTGPRILNNLKDQHFYKNSKSKNVFIKRYKKYLIDMY